MKIYTEDEIKHMLKCMMINELFECEKFDGGKIDMKYIESFGKRLIENMEEKHEWTQSHFSKKKQIYNIGDKLFPVDMSSFMQHDESDNVSNYFKADDVREKLRTGRKPLIVVKAEPYQHDWHGQTEYFIDVKFENSDEIYRIFNSDCLVYDNWLDYECYLESAEEDAAFGY